MFYFKSLHNMVNRQGLPLEAIMKINLHKRNYIIYILPKRLYSLSSTGFTLVEAMVVVAIIGILVATVGIYSVSYRKSAISTDLKALAGEVINVEETHYTLKGSYWNISKCEGTYHTSTGGVLKVPKNTCISAAPYTGSITGIDDSGSVSTDCYDMNITRTNIPGGGTIVVEYDSCQDRRPHLK